jgi:hypothetical protein
MEVSLCFLIARTYSLEKVQDYRPARFLKLFILIFLAFFAQLPMQNVPSAAISEAEFLQLKRTNQWRNIMDEKPEYLPAWANLADIWSRRRDDRVVTISGRASTRVTEWAPEADRSKSGLIRCHDRISTYYYRVKSPWTGETPLM